MLPDALPDTVRRSVFGRSATPYAGHHDPADEPSAFPTAGDPRQRWRTRMPGILSKLFVGWGQLIFTGSTWTEFAPFPDASRRGA